jgi:tetratricopeptide (TPR) repeat protein
MRVSRIGFRAVCVIAAWMLATLCLTNVEAATIAGVVRDAQGHPVEAVQVKVACDQSPERDAKVSSGKDGAYRFVGLLPCKYRISAERSGFGVATSTAVTVPATASTVVTDLILNTSVQGSDPTIPQSQLGFEAAGIRGLIDPGGYSAPANAAAASGLISGIADIERTENRPDFLTAKNLPCTLESELTANATAHPHNANANRRIGEFYLVHGSASQAIPYFERARETDTTNSRTVEDLSESLLMGRQFSAARGLLLGQPKDMRGDNYYHLLARAEEGLGHFTQASEQYQIAAGKEASEENTFGSGYELILAGRPADAAKIFKEGVTRFPPSVTLLIGAGAANFLQGYSSAAVDLFLQATDLKPSDSRSYAFLVKSFEVSGAHGDQVRASLKRHLELSPSDPEAYYFYAIGLLHGDANHGAADNGEAESLLEHAIRLDPNLAKAHIELGSLYARRKNYEGSAREFEAAERLVPDMNEVHYRLASAYKKTGRAGAAEREMKLFSEARESTKDDGRQDEISIDQFISVINRPGQAADRHLQCPHTP